MSEAFIIDAVRTPRGIGKMGKGALSQMHPEHLAATVLAALVERNKFNTADVDDVIWGVSGQIGLQAGDVGRMAALDAGYDIRASGVTLKMAAREESLGVEFFVTRREMSVSFMVRRRGWEGPG